MSLSQDVRGFVFQASQVTLTVPWPCPTISFRARLTCMDTNQISTRTERSGEGPRVGLQSRCATSFVRARTNYSH
jgi:hypothetical protein